MSVLSSHALRHYESAEEPEIRRLTKAISISYCGRVMSELMNKTKRSCIFRKLQPNQKSISLGQIISAGKQKSS